MMTGKFGRTLLSVGMAVLLALSAAACEEEGPAEKAGKEIDKAAEKAADTAKETYDALKKKVNE